MCAQVQARWSRKGSCFASGHSLEDNTARIFLRYIFPAKGEPAYMNLHEYQAKSLFAEYGIPIPKGSVAHSAAEARTAAGELGGEVWVVKAQVHAGGRGKAGGVKVVKSHDEVEKATEQMLGQRLVTPQTDAKGLPINSVM